MDLSWLFGGVSEKRDKALADKLTIAWEIDQSKLGPLAMKLDEAKDIREKAVFATMIAYHIDGCYKDLFSGFEKAVASVPKDQVGTLWSFKSLKRIHERVTAIHEQIDTYTAILSKEEIAQIVSELDQNKQV